MFNKLNLGKMRENEYYFVQKSNKKEYFPCRVIKLHNSWAEVENLETEKKEDLIFIHHKTEIDIRFQNRFQKINTFIEEKEVVLCPFIPSLGEDNSSLSLEIFLFLTKKDEIKKLEKKFNNEWNEYLKEVEKCRIERDIKRKEFVERLKKLNYIITIEDLFERLEEKYNITFSLEEKRNIILKLDKPQR